jgi:hypothetical protein
MYNAYRDISKPGVEIRLSKSAAWRVYPDGREEGLSPDEMESWYRRLKTDKRRAARNKRRGEFDA